MHITIEKRKWVWITEINWSRGSHTWKVPERRQTKMSCEWRALSRFLFLSLFVGVLLLLLLLLVVVLLGCTESSRARWTWGSFRPRGSQCSAEFHWITLNMYFFFFFWFYSLSHQEIHLFVHKLLSFTKRLISFTSPNLLINTY